MCITGDIANMKILFYAPCIGFGGVERVIENLACNLPSSYEILIAGQVQLDRNLLSQACLPPNVQLLPTMGPEFESDRYIPMFAFKLYRLIANSRPDIVLSFWRRPNITAGIVNLLMATKTRPSWILSVHGECPGYEPSGFTNICKASLLKWLSSRADAHVTITNKLVTKCNNYFPGANFKLLFNPAVGDKITQAAVEPLDHPWFVGGGRVILAMGRLDPMKDFTTLINAFKIISDNDSTARLLILGEGPLRSVLQAKISELNLSTKILMPGFEPNPYKYLARCTVFVSSSTHGEASPMVLSEAMFLSRPVVVTNFFTASDLIDDGVDGFIVNPGSCCDIANKVLYLLQNPDRCVKIGELARQKSIERYHVVDATNRYSLLFEDLIGGRQGCNPHDPKRLR